MVKDESAAPVVTVEDLTAEVERLKKLLGEERVKTALLTTGVEPAKVARAARLVDAGAVGTGGAVDGAKLDAEVAALLSEYPELKKAAPEKPAGFKIGSDGQSKASTNDMIMSIFGNKSKS